MKISKIPKFLLMYSLMMTTSHGAVLLQDTFSHVSAQNAFPTDLGGGVYGYEIDTTGFSAAGHGKLVLSYSTKDEDSDGSSGGDVGGALFSTISFNGNSMTEAVSEFNFNRGSAGVWYLDGVVSDGVIRLEVANSSSAISEFAFGLYALDGLKSGVQDTAFGNTPTDATVTVTTGSGFVVQEAVRNNQSFSPSGTDDYETLYNASVQSYRGLQQYQVTDAAGDYNAPVGNTNTKLIVGAAFEVIPEPSSALLGGLGALLLLRRRR